jgi:type II secretory pathway pseudopilin PulG
MRILVNHDGQQLGPYSLEEVRAALAAGTLNATDLAWVEGTPSWVALSSLVGGEAAQPAVGVASPQYGSPQQFVPQQGQTSGLAITSLVLGILSFFCFSILASIPAVICGHIARGRIRNSQGREKGEGIALGGLICGYINIAMVPIMFALMLPAISAAKDKGQEVVAMNDARQIAMACMMYANDHDGKYPASLEELTANPSFDQTALHRPGSEGFDYYGAGKTESKIENPSTTPLVAGKKANRQGRRPIGYADGHASIDVLPPEAGH